jgi:hypothetical protein
VLLTVPHRRIVFTSQTRCIVLGRSRPGKVSTAMSPCPWRIYPDALSASRHACVQVHCSHQIMHMT